MKNFQSTTEGVWTERVSVQLTDIEKQLMRSQEPADVESKEILLNRLREEREQITTVEKSDALSAFYAGIKPILNETDLYELIACNLTENGTGLYNGILNYRLNDEHKQLRFQLTGN